MVFEYCGNWVTPIHLASRYIPLRGVHPLYQGEECTTHWRKIPKKVSYWFFFMISNYFYCSFFVTKCFHGLYLCFRRYTDIPLRKRPDFKVFRKINSKITIAYLIHVPNHWILVLPKWCYIDYKMSLFWKRQMNYHSKSLPKKNVVLNPKVIDYN